MSVKVDTYEELVGWLTATANLGLRELDMLTDLVEFIYREEEGKIDKKEILLTILEKSNPNFRREVTLW